LAADPDTNRPQAIGHTVAEISEKASLLVREEIELAKAEITRKATSLGKGIAVVVAAGIFAVFGLIYFLHFAAWLLYDLFFDQVFWGYLIVTVFLFLLAAIAGLVGYRWIKKGAPPTPDMAIEEAKRIQETVKA
jgi:H+/Cl- antiporter ClcA